MFWWHRQILKESISHNERNDKDQGLDKTVLLFLIINGEKINLLCMINKAIVSDHLNAGTIIKELSKYIKGGGGGQAFFATAGGKDNSQTEKVVEEFKAYLGR